MKIVVDMNISSQLCGVLERNGFNAVHWSDIGDKSATDREIMRWAVEHKFIVLTHDLDFGAMLAATQDKGPSVIQIRTQDVMVDHLGPILLSVLKTHQSSLETGALIVVDEVRCRVRILPLQR